MKIIKIESMSEISENFTGMVEYPNGSKHWYLNGKFHRENDLPAVEHANGTKMWYFNGLRHRENDLPAIENANGTKYWYLNGVLHRENDLPAIERSDRTKEWYLNGLVHRETGPAVEYPDGHKEWWLNGNFLSSEKEWKKELEKLKMNKTIQVKDFSELPKDFTGIAEFVDGTKSWWLNGKLHRENDLPAMEFPNGSKHWFLNGKLHRENDLPAVEHVNGHKEWWLNGLVHRETGPAIEWSDGTKKWYLNGQEYSEEEWKKEVGLIKVTKTTKEIERKFLCNNSVLDKILKNSKVVKADNIVQGYLSADPTVRVRIVETADKTTAFLTVKGKGLVARDEFEYNIPVEDAKAMLEKLSDRQLKKTRYYIDFKNHSWSVDVFQNGLILAEIELSDENEKFEVPPWVIMEVSLMKEFSNVALAQKTTK